MNKTDKREPEPWPGNPEMVSDECWQAMLDEAEKAGHYVSTVRRSPPETEGGTP